MKYIVILGDGMADYPVEELGNKTPLTAANKPMIDTLAKKSEIGLVKTVPDHLKPPGSDIANMSVMGYDPDVYYTGRSPLEAVSMGITMKDDDLAIRCNVVHLSEDEEEYEKKTMVDYSSDEISTAESKVLMEYIDEKLGTPDMKFYPGVSYRHCIIADMPGKVVLGCTPPHDITGRCIEEYMPAGEDGKFLIDYMKKSYDLLLHHPINEARRAKGLNTANSIWPWGEGRKPGLSNFEKKYNLKGAVISAVDLVMGLGMCADMEVIKVPDVTGNIKTNFDGKAQAAIDYLTNKGDFVYLHMEAPDECGHRHEIENKKKSIEIIDNKVVKPIYEALKASGEDFKILIMPDHPTPLAIRTHTHEPVPYMIYDSRNDGCEEKADAVYDEVYATSTGIYKEIGFRLMDHFIFD
ncbi:MAG: cofactor-independent phosphoglycerate mutase [Ruminococcaceae bacterium]|nr:cofactor-independent phosphoglycerate mutase [Oscillospiraceae bacterium]